MNLLLIAQAFPPITASGVARPFRFYKYLPQHGIDVHVVTDDPHLQPQSPPRVDRVPDAQSSTAATKQSQWARRIQRWALPYDENLPWVPYAVERGVELIDKLGVEAILSTSPPIATHLVALWIRRHRNVRWIADFRDPLWGNPFRTRRWLFNYDPPLERRIMNTADVILANTDGLLAQWEKRYPECRSKMRLLWNGYDPEQVPPPQPVAQRSRRVLSHVGTLYGGRHPGALLKSVHRLIQKGALDPESIELQFIGEFEDSHQETYREALDFLKSRGCIQTINRLPRDEANRRMGQADYLLLLDLNDHGASVQVPAKIFDYLCTERPILAFTNHGSPVERILQGSQVDHALIFEDTAVEELDRRVLAFFTAGPRLTRPSAWFRDTFDGARQAETLAAIIRGEPRQQASRSSLGEPVAASPLGKG